MASFAGGNFIFGGVLLKEQKYIDFGLILADSYFEPYRQTAVNIGPESFRWTDAALPVDDEFNLPAPAGEADFYETAGFWASSPQYILRPETMESLYMAYRVTGDKKWQDLVWKGYSAIVEATRTGSAFAELADVTAPAGGEFDDMMESFFLAETLKYVWLTFAEESDVQFKVNGTNEWVYNTEAHPVHIRGA